MYGFILFLSQHSPSFSRHNFRSFPFFFPRFCQVSQTVRRLCAANCHQGNDLGSFLPYYYAVPWYWESIWSVEVWMGDSKEKKMLTCGCCEGIKEGAGGLTMSEEGEENPPPQQFWRPSCYELTKTPRLWPEVVSARRGVPEHSPCNKSDLAILLGQVRLRLK